MANEIMRLQDLRAEELNLLVKTQFNQIQLMQKLLKVNSKN